MKSANDLTILLSRPTSCQSLSSVEGLSVRGRALVESWASNELVIGLEVCVRWAGSASGLGDRTRR